jgi:hypothetical protein
MCVEIQKGMTLMEVVKARSEFTAPKGHEEELDKVIAEKFKKEIEELEKVIEENQRNFGGLV